MKPESALIAVVPEAEPLVGSFRQRFDPSAAVGVPAHITVLYPFRVPGMLDDGTLEILTRCFQRLSPIAFQLAELRAIEGEALYLAPDPDEPFRQLTMEVWRLFPENPPYGGQWPDVVPHLSVARSKRDEELDDVAVELRQSLDELLPIKATIREVVLIENMSRRWKPRTKFILGN